MPFYALRRLAIAYTVLVLDARWLHHGQAGVVATGPKDSGPVAYESRAAVKAAELILSLIHI